MQEISLKIKELIAEGYENFHDLNIVQKLALTELIYDHNDLDWLYSTHTKNILTHNIFKENICHSVYIHSYLQTAVVKYYQDDLVELYDEVKDTITAEKNTEKGLRRFIDPINGEVRWLK
jgi:hypothetical protein